MADDNKPMREMNLAEWMAQLPERHAANREYAKLLAFKGYVHERLDSAGIPTHPDGPHSAEGCRVGDRLDIALGVIEPAARVYRGLNERIENAPGDAVPIFDGIAELHDALGPLGSATAPADGVTDRAE